MAGTLEIVREQRANNLELKVSGRLDAYWATHLADAIREVLREGVHHLRLNLAQTSFLSSPGIRVLLTAYKEFAVVNGTFAIVHPSRPVKQVLDLVGLGPLLCKSGAELIPQAEAVAERTEVEGCIFDTYDYHPDATLACRIAGRPGPLSAAAFGEADCEVIDLPKDVFAIGVGAFGEGFAACRDSFGEFIAVAGNAACQLTDGTNCADYLVASGDLVPKVTALYGIACRGGFRKLMRFECSPALGPVRFSTVIAQAQRCFPGTALGLVLVVESAGLLGAALRRPPVATGTSPLQLFQHPEIRHWLSFSPERQFTRAVAVIAGVVSNDPPEHLLPLVRPLVPGGTMQGHFHAAAFGYRSLQKGRIDLQPAVLGLFDTGGLLAVFHLLTDDRPTASAVESEFLRGACWFGPLDRFVSGQETL